MDVTTAFARGLRAERARARIPQGDLAEALGKSRAWVAAVEAGTISVSLADALALCQALGVSLATLLAEIDPELHRAAF